MVNFKVAITEMYPWIPLGTGRGSLGIFDTHVGPLPKLLAFCARKLYLRHCVKPMKNKEES